MVYAETRMTVTPGDVASTTTATVAMSMPWWIVHLPEMAAIIVAILGIPIAILTLGIKYNEWQIVRIRRKEAEQELITDSDFEQTGM